MSLSADPVVRQGLVRTETVFETGHARPDREGIITVSVSLYNYDQYIKQCLESVLNQTHSRIELIVVDDASTRPGSIKVAADWLDVHAPRFERVLLLRHCRNQGLAAARNTGFAHAMGDWVFVIDADNLIYPRALARLHAAAVESGASAAYSQLEHFGSEECLGFADVWLPEAFRTRNYIDAMALVSKSAWRRVGGYSHLDGGWEDYDFWCKFVEHDLEAIFVPEILCRYRVHPTSMLRTETKRAYRELFVEMSMRHPWLDLQFED